MATLIVGWVLLSLWTIYVLGMGVLVGAMVYDPEKRAMLDQSGKAIRLLFVVMLLAWPLVSLLGWTLDKAGKLED